MSSPPEGKEKVNPAPARRRLRFVGFCTRVDSGGWEFYCGPQGITLVPSLGATPPTLGEAYDVDYWANQELHPINIKNLRTQTVVTYDPTFDPPAP